MQLVGGWLSLSWYKKIEGKYRVVVVFFCSNMFTIQYERILSTHSVILQTLWFRPYDNQWPRIRRCEITVTVKGKPIFLRPKSWVRWMIRHQRSRINHLSIKRAWKLTQGCTLYLLAMCNLLGSWLCNDHSSWDCTFYLTIAMTNPPQRILGLSSLIIWH